MLKGTKHTEESKKKVGDAFRGKKISEEHRQKIIASLTGKFEERSRGWKGQDICYSGIHIWIRNKLGKPNYCEHCKKTDCKRYDWANVSREYKRVVSDWIRLCRGCHRRYDHKYSVEHNHKRQTYDKRRKQT